MIILLAYANQLVGVNYKWGGNNPIEGFDCSGLVMELLKSTGEPLPASDMTAQQLFDHYQTHGEWNRIQAGSLVWYGESVTKITHVAMLLDDTRVIEAAGGSQTTLDRNDAAVKNAFVRVRPIDYRKDRVAIIRPHYRTIKQI